MSFLDSGDEEQDTGEESADEATVISRNVASTCLSNLTYHRDTHELFMTFTDGRQYVIADFPEIELERWLGSPSIGGYFNAFVRGNY